MERILVIGSPGSGKSYFSRALAEVTGLPLYHLDNIYWKDTGEHISREELRLRLAPILAGERWIIDGNFSATFEYRLAHATTVMLLDIDFDICEAGIRSRVGMARSDIPFVEADVPVELIEAARRYRSYTMPKMLEVLNRYPRVKLLRFYTREEVNNYLHCLNIGGNYGE